MPTGQVLRAIAFLHERPEDNYYARPVEGLTAYLNTDTGEVIIEDHGVAPIPIEAYPSPLHPKRTRRRSTAQLIGAP